MKLAIINKKFLTKAVLIVFNIAKLYTVYRVCSFDNQFRNKVTI